MKVLAVDLAAKYSAACVMDDNHQIHEETDSFGHSEDAFVARLIAMWNNHEADLMVIEDLPHGLSFSHLVKTVCRIQGRIVHAMSRNCDCNKLCGGDQNEIIFVAPATWRAHYTGMHRGTGPAVVVPISEALGYKPPAEELYARAKGHGGRSRAGKVITDYCSAYLIGRWAIDTAAEYKNLAVPGTSRYGQKAILKKDFNAENH